MTTNLVLYDVMDLVKTGTGWSPGHQSAWTVSLGGQAGHGPDDKPSVTDLLTYRQLAAELREVEDRFATLKGDQTIDELCREKDYLAEHQEDLTMPLRVQMHRQLAFSFACFTYHTGRDTARHPGTPARETECQEFAIALGLVLVAITALLFLASHCRPIRVDAIPDRVDPEFYFPSRGRGDVVAGEPGNLSSLTFCDDRPCEWPPGRLV